MSNLKNKSSTLLFITEEYPYGDGEAFIENEIDELSNSFKKLIIFSKGDTSKNKRIYPKNITIINTKFQLNFIEKVLFIKVLFSKHFWNEIKFLYSYKLTFSKTNISYCIISLLRAQKFSKIIKANVSISNNIYIYTYWCMDETLGSCMMKKEFPNLKVFSRAHRMDLYFYAHPNGYLPFRKYILENIDKIFTISKNGEKYLTDFTKYNKNKVVTSYLGVKRNINKLNFQNLNSKFKIVSCSNIYPNKRIELIIKALENIDLDLTWHHYGGFTNSTTDDYKSLINKEIKKLNQKVKIKGRMTNREILLNMKKNKYDLFINVSRSEGLPVSIMEAFSLGIPVIATNVGGVNEIVINNYNGFLIDENISIEALSKKITDFFKLNIHQVHLLKNNAYSTWEKKFNSEYNYKSFIEIVKDI